MRYRRKLKEKIIRLRAHAEDARIAGNDMHHPGARDVMRAMAETYERLARTRGFHDPASKDTA